MQHLVIKHIHTFKLHFPFKFTPYYHYRDGSINSLGAKDDIATLILDHVLVTIVLNST